MLDTFLYLEGFMDPVPKNTILGSISWNFARSFSSSYKSILGISKSKLSSDYFLSPPGIAV